MSEELKIFGKYRLLDLLSQGGMAEIWRALPLSSDRVGDVVIIKRILDNNSGGDNFITMFKWEAETTRQLTSDTVGAPDERRGSIGKVLEYGEEDGRHYLVMEYINGKNLKQLSSKFEARDPMPWEMAAYIVAKAAGGLHYAHDFRDPVSGNPLDLVHRDIKPMNIMVSFDGKVKLIDFGIAKATTSIDKTATNIIKGTVRYLSPEQITGEKLDGRSDQFSLGIVLWELLTGRKLFDGKGDLDILKKIEACNNEVKNPIQFRPDLPQSLCRIVLQSLARDRKHRFTNLGQMQAALLDCLRDETPQASEADNQHGFSQADLAHAMTDRFRVEFKDDNRKLLAKVEQARELAKSTPQFTVNKSGRREEKILELAPDAPPVEDVRTVPKSADVQPRRQEPVLAERPARAAAAPAASSPSVQLSGRAAGGPRPIGTTGAAAPRAPGASSPSLQPKSTSSRILSPNGSGTPARPSGGASRAIGIPRWLIPAAAAAGLLFFVGPKFASLIGDLTGAASRSPADIGLNLGGSMQKRDYIDFTRGNEDAVEIRLLVTPDGDDTVIQGQGPDLQPPLNFGKIRKLRVGKGASVTIWASHPLWNDGERQEWTWQEGRFNEPITLKGGPNQTLGLLEIESVNRSSSLNVLIEQSGRRIHTGIAGPSNFIINLPHGEYDVSVSLGQPGDDSNSGTPDPFKPKPCRIRINGSRYLPVNLGPGEPSFCPPEG